jgi:hypothetical protein
MVGSQREFLDNDYIDHLNVIVTKGCFANVEEKFGRENQILADYFANFKGNSLREDGLSYLKKDEKHWDQIMKRLHTEPTKKFEKTIEDVSETSAQISFTISPKEVATHLLEARQHILEDLLSHISKVLEDNIEEIQYMNEMDLRDMVGSELDRIKMNTANAVETTRLSESTISEDLRHRINIFGTKIYMDRVREFNTQSEKRENRFVVDQLFTRMVPPPAVADVMDFNLQHRPVNLMKNFVANPFDKLLSVEFVLGKLALIYSQVASNRKEARSRMSSYMNRNRMEESSIAGQGQNSTGATALESRKEVTKADDEEFQDGFEDLAMMVAEELESSYELLGNCLRVLLRQSQVDLEAHLLSMHIDAEEAASIAESNIMMNPVEEASMDKEIDLMADGTVTEYSAEWISNLSKSPSTAMFVGNGADDGRDRASMPLKASINKRIVRSAFDSPMLEIAVKGEVLQGGERDYYIATYLGKDSNFSFDASDEVEVVQEPPEDSSDVSAGKTDSGDLGDSSTVDDPHSDVADVFGAGRKGWQQEDGPDGERTKPGTEGAKKKPSVLLLDPPNRPPEPPVDKFDRDDDDNDDYAESGKRVQYDDVPHADNLSEYAVLGPNPRVSTYTYASMNVYYHIESAT